jgi:3-oxoacyl-[acyl-carrier-protein] synthase II
MVGGGMAADAYHLTGTHPDGLGAKLCISRALNDAGLGPSDINYINAHATSTGIGDISEMKGVESIFGDQQVHISATKSMTGHLLGAAGAVEGIISVLSVKHNIIPGTINTVNIDEHIPANLNIVIGKSIQRTVNYSLNNTFGFGGHTASSIFKKFSR